MLVFVSDMSGGGWFEDTDGRNDDESAFLAVLREAAAAWSMPGLDSSATGFEEYLEPLYVYLEVPLEGHVDRESPAALPWTLALELAFWSGSPHGLSVEGSWGDSIRPLDGGPAPDVR